MTRQEFLDEVDALEEEIGYMKVAEVILEAQAGRRAFEQIRKTRSIIRRLESFLRELRKYEPI
jgi:flagellin-specific chaperone FliS